MQQIARSIETFGFNNPVLIDSDGEIIAGHGRFEAAQQLQLQLEKVPCIVLDHLNDEQKRAFRIADNRLSESGGGWDEELLTLELSELKAMDFNIGITGFDDLQWQNMLPDKMTRSSDGDDDVPELPLPEDTRTCPGDLWLLGDHRLLCGDSTRSEDMARLAGKATVDCIWTDPPFNVNYQGGTGMTIRNDHMDASAFRQFLTRIFTHCFAMARTGCPIYVAYADSENVAFRESLAVAGWKLSQTLIWAKQHFKLSRQDYHWQHEPIIYGLKEGSEHSWYIGRTQSTIMDAHLVLENMSHEALLKLARSWQYVIASTVIREKKPSTSAEHPTMKPVSLVLRMLVNSSQAGDRVLDPCGGSGSTLIACEKLKRHALLMEIDPQYCDVIIRRWQTFTGKDAVNETTGQTFTMKEQQVA